MADAILVSQFEFWRMPFWFHNLNFLVPVKGIVLFNFFFLSYLFFSIYISFVKCKYYSIVFSFFVNFRPLMKPKGESA